MGYIVNQDEFRIVAQEFWETKGNATQLDENLVDFFFELSCRIWAGTIEWEGERIKGYDDGVREDEKH